jgi:Protein O-mannosyl-transferase TMEM260-like
VGQIALMVIFARFRRGVPILVGLLALVVYLLTLAPDITWAHNGADGGDLIAASFAGGAAHPPGYPLYTLVGRLVAALPIGPIPYRYNLFSALAAAGAAALVAWSLRETGVVPALASGLSLAFAPLVWSQAVITEVYALSALLAAFTVALSMQASPRPLMLGMAFGLCLTHHLTLSLLAPLALAAWTRWAGKQGARQVTIRAMAGILIGLLPLAYLPLTARATAGWGDASTLAGFWWLVSAQLYRGYVFALPVAWIIPRAAEVARTLAGSFTWIGVVVGLWGLVTLWEHDRWRGVASLASALAIVAFAVGYNTADSQVYLISALVVFAVWMGLGWGAMRVGSQSQVFGVGLTILMLAIPAFTLTRNWSAQDLCADHAARDFVDGTMAAAPERAIVVTTEDRHTFALWVGAFVEGGRPDLAVVDRDLMQFDWYRARLRRGLGLVVLDTQDADELARLNPDRPLCRPTEAATSPWLWCEGK